MASEATRNPIGGFWWRGRIFYRTGYRNLPQGCQMSHQGRWLREVVTGWAASVHRACSQRNARRHGRDWYSVVITDEGKRTHLSDGLHGWYRVRKIEPTNQTKVVYNPQLPGSFHRRKAGGHPWGWTLQPVLPGDPHHQGNEGENEWTISKLLRLGERARRFLLQRWYHN